MPEAALDARARRLLVSRAPLDQVPATEFLPALAGILGTGLVLAQRVSLAESERPALVAATLLAGPTNAVSRWQRDAGDPAWQEQLAGLRDAVGGDSAFYFSVRWAVLGAIRVKSVVLIPHAVTLARRALGCLLTTPAGDQGLRLDLLEPSNAGQPELELIVWGDAWRRAAELRG